MYDNKFFVSFYAQNGNLYANGKALQGRGVGIEDLNAIIGVEIDLNNNNLIWSLNNKAVYLAEIPIHLFNTKMNPCISMTSAGDRIELIN